MRNFCSNLFGLAAVVGFENAFGLSTWGQQKPLLMIEPKRGYSDISILPGGITYVTDVRYIQSNGTQFLVGR